MTSVVVNDSPLLIELFAPMRFDDANDNDDPDKATFEALKELSRTRTQLDTAKRQTAHLKTLTDAELATLTLRPGDVVGGRVIVHATESEPIVGISVALRAAVHWAAPTAATPTTGTGVVSARDAAFGRAEEDLFRLVQVLFGANIMASLDMARTMPHERLSRGTHVLPFSLRLPDRPPSTVLPSFAVPALGVAVTYTLSAVLERRDAGASNLVRPLPADSAALSAIAQAHYLEAGKTKSLHSRAVAASAYPRPTPVHSASEHQPHRAIAASAPKASSPEPQYAAPPIVVIDLPHLGRNRTSTAASAVSANERPDSGYGVVGGGHELPQPPTNAMPAEAGYGVVDENGAPVNSSGYAGVPFANADAPYHSVPPLAGEEDTDPDDVVEPYAPIDSKRESHTFDTVALPETVAVSSTAAARPTRVESGGGGGGAGAGSRLRLPEIVHPVKSPRLARPQPVRGISGAHIAATIVSLQCMGARVLTPPRDWQVVSAESSKKRLFSRKLVRLEMKLPRSVFVAGHTVNVSIGKRSVLCLVGCSAWSTELDGCQCFTVAAYDGRQDSLFPTGCLS
jgi:hypothetical protein